MEEYVRLDGIEKRKDLLIQQFNATLKMGHEFRREVAEFLGNLAFEGYVEYPDPFSAMIDLTPDPDLDADDYEHLCINQQPNSTAE